MVDNGRQVLAQLQDSLSVTACKLADEDGDPATSDDQSPLEGWTIDLLADGEHQEPSQQTGPSGCITFNELQPSTGYGVEEEQRRGWTPLTPISHEFGVLVPGEAYVHTFLNLGYVTITACKVADADGVLTTTVDQTPVADWTVYLSVDGERQEPGQLTAGDGCQTWSELEVGPSYGVEEEVRASWTALTSATHELGTLSAGEIVTHTFANVQTGAEVYLPLIMRNVP
jgi:hypothetical protein